MSDAGIRFVVVQTLRNCKIDGACFWLADDSPVIALSIRFDRIDNFWFTLFHELHHCIEGEKSIDEDINNKDAMAKRPTYEQKADEFAKSTILDQHALDAFITKTSPRFSRNSIDDFARKHRVHPGLVVGQLQHCGVVEFKNFRSTFVPIREIVSNSAVLDGWGITAATTQTDLSRN